MSPAIRLYYNPACSKCRALLALLEERRIQPHIIEYLQHPPDAAELAELLCKLGGSPLAIVRSKDAAFTASGLHEGSSAEEVVAALLVSPALLERPIVVVGERAVIARPPEKVLALLTTG